MLSEIPAFTVSASVRVTADGEPPGTRYAKQSVRDEIPPGRRTLKRPSGPVCGLGIAAAAAPTSSGVAVRSTDAPEIGAPPGPVSRPRIVWSRPYRLARRSLRVPFQLTVRAACWEVDVPTGAPAAHGGGG